MNNKKLYKYLDKIGASYEVHDYGYNYFYNVAPLLGDMAIVYFDHSGAFSDVAKELQRKKMIETYCKKYGFKIFYRAAAGSDSWFWVTNQKLYDDVSYMGEFVRRSIDACEKLNHLYLIGKTTIKSDAELNNKMKLIMDRFGREYKRMAFIVCGGAAV